MTNTHRLSLLLSLGRPNGRPAEDLDLHDFRCDGRDADGNVDRATGRARCSGGTCCGAHWRARHRAGGPHWSVGDDSGFGSGLRVGRRVDSVDTPVTCRRDRADDCIDRHRRLVRLSVGADRRQANQKVTLKAFVDTEGRAIAAEALNAGARCVVGCSPRVR